MSALPEGVSRFQIVQHVVISTLETKSVADLKRPHSPLGTLKDLESFYQILKVFQNFRPRFKKEE